MGSFSMNPIKATSIYVFVEWYLVMFFPFLSFDSNSCGGCPIKYWIELQNVHYWSFFGFYNLVIFLGRERGKCPKHLYSVCPILDACFLGFLSVPSCSSNSVHHSNAQVSLLFSLLYTISFAPSFYFLFHVYFQKEYEKIIGG